MSEDFNSIQNGYSGNHLTTCVIQIFGVASQYQRQGVATKLVQALLDNSRSKKIKPIRAMIDERDSELQGFFKRLGFDRGRNIVFSKTVSKTF
ncbi:MAG: hypothetical protein A2157_17885 [Deltaproteobacteria bacterium RBG_16_47_11]|nr:MAG: hypothetical protein A2157_17885 [Deltaproteobacteria bacterium RBG_16_47_11]